MEDVIQALEVRQHWGVIVINAPRTLIRGRKLRTTVAEPPRDKNNDTKTHRGQELRAAVA